MPNKSASFIDSVDQQVSAVRDKVTATVDQVKDSVADLSRVAADKVNQNRAAMAGRLDKAASAIRETADNPPGVQQVTDAAHAAAGKLKSTAKYVKRSDVRSMMADVGTLVKNNPGPSIVGAAVIGFMLGRAFSNSDRT